MPRKASPKTEENTTVPPPTKEPKVRKSRKTENTATETQTQKETSKPSQTTESETKTRRAPTRESVEAEFDELMGTLDTEISRLQESDQKNKGSLGVKTLRSLKKRVKTLKNHALRISKVKSSVKRNNTNSGFKKPVQISKELAKFAGWNPQEPRSRSEVTKFICNYIKEKNLQDPVDRRNIRVETDPSFMKLLKFDSGVGKPLTYYSLQTYLTSHFPPSQKKTATTSGHQTK